MNKDQARKLAAERIRVRLQPPARRAGIAADDDWLVAAVDDESVKLEHTAMHTVAVIGHDGVDSYFSEPGRNTPTQRYGCLRLFVQVDIRPDGTVSTTPLPRQALATSSVDPLDTDAGRLATQRYRSLPLAWRATVAYLLSVGSATEQQVAATLAPIGFADGGQNVLAGIANTTQLVQRVQQEDTKATILLGYRGPYRANPAMEAALRVLVAQDPELGRMLAMLQ
jgi:hypothetical protein